MSDEKNEITKWSDVMNGKHRSQAVSGVDLELKPEGIITEAALRIREAQDGYYDLVERMATVLVPHGSFVRQLCFDHSDNVLSEDVFINANTGELAGSVWMEFNEDFKISFRFEFYGKYAKLNPNPESQTKTHNRI